MLWIAGSLHDVMNQSSGALATLESMHTDKPLKGAQRESLSLVRNIAYAVIHIIMCIIHV